MPKSERMKIREMELDHEMAMQRERLVADWLGKPQNIYLVGMVGSGVATYIGALLDSVNPKIPEEKKKKNADILAAGLFVLAGPVGLVQGEAALWVKDTFTGSKDSVWGPMPGLLTTMGAGGTAFFAGLLIIHEMCGGEGGGGGGIMEKLMAAAAVA